MASLNLAEAALASILTSNQAALKHNEGKHPPPKKPRYSEQCAHTSMSKLSIMGRLADMCKNYIHSTQCPSKSRHTVQWHRTTI